MLNRAVLPALAGGFLAVSGTVFAQQDYPNRPITMVIPFAAGGPTDILGRVVAQRMSESLGQQIVVENVGGGGGQTGSRRVIEAKSDGYTILLGTVGTHAQSQTISKRPIYNAAADFTPIALLADAPLALIARKDFPAADLKEFIAYAQANASKMQFGSSGAGSATHLGCIVANMAMGTNIVHVPYKGSGPAMHDLQGGRLDFMCTIVSLAKPQIDGGTVKAFAIMTKERSPALPNLPTALEQGVPGMEAYTWNALFLPKDAAAPIVKKLADAANESLNTPAVKERLEGLGVDVVSPQRRTPEYLGEFVKSEIEKWREPILKSGAQSD
ncbi:MAG: tripartite tricarboxylate transporter substrate-binding protein [Pseudorhodoplanes sp.]